jgi:hypothetical protein
MILFDVGIFVLSIRIVKSGEFPIGNEILIGDSLRFLLSFDNKFCGIMKFVEIN